MFAASWLRDRLRYLGDVELISDARLGQDVAGLGGLRFDFLSQLVDENAQINHFVSIIRSPYRLQEPAVRNRGIRAGGKILQKIELGGGQADFVAADDDAAGGKMNLQVGRFEGRRGRFGGQRRAAQPGADACQQLLHAEGLRYV